jgi:hypothetical protein
MMDTKWNNVISVMIFSYLPTNDLTSNIYYVNHQWRRLLQFPSTWTTIGHININDINEVTFLQQQLTPLSLQGVSSLTCSLSSSQTIDFISLLQPFASLRQLTLQSVDGDDILGSVYLPPHVSCSLTRLHVIGYRSSVGQLLCPSLLELKWYNQSYNWHMLHHLPSLTRLHLCGGHWIDCEIASVGRSLRILFLDGVLAARWKQRMQHVSTDRLLPVIEHVAITLHLQDSPALVVDRVIRCDITPLLQWFGHKLISLRIDLALLYGAQPLQNRYWPHLQRLHLDHSQHGPDALGAMFLDWIGSCEHVSSSPLHQLIFSTPYMRQLPLLTICRSLITWYRQRPLSIIWFIGDLTNTIKARDCSKGWYALDDELILCRDENESHCWLISSSPPSSLPANHLILDDATSNRSSSVTTSSSSQLPLEMIRVLCDLYHHHCDIQLLDTLPPSLQCDNGETLALYGHLQHSS